MKSRLQKILGFQALFCILPLLLIGGFQSQTFDCGDSCCVFIPEIKKNSSSLFTFIDKYNCIISNDGTNTSAETFNRVFFGGSEDAGGVDGKNASAVINAAINMFSGSGGKIKVLEGSYLLDSRIVFCSNLELHCVNNALFNLGYNGVVFDFCGVNNSAIKGASLFGNRENFTGTAIIIQDHLGTGSGNISVTNNHIFNFGSRGISIEGVLSSNNNVSYNTVEDLLHEGIMVSRANNNIIFCNYVEKTGLHGIISTGGNFNIISNNTVLDSGANYVSGFAHGIAVDGNEGLNPCFGNIVSNNTVITTFMAGIEVADGAHNSTIKNNYVANTSDYGVYFGGSFEHSSNGVITENVLCNCGLNTDQGILISGASNNKPTSQVIIYGNMIDSAGKDGIQLKWVNHVQVIENTCFNCAGYGLTIKQSNFDSIIVSKNNKFNSNILGEVHRSV